MERFICWFVLSLDSRLRGNDGEEDGNDGEEDGNYAGCGPEAVSEFYGK